MTQQEILKGYAKHEGKGWWPKNLSIRIIGMLAPNNEIEDIIECWEEPLQNRTYPHGFTIEALRGAAINGLISRQSLTLLDGVDFCHFQLTGEAHSVKGGIDEAIIAALDEVGE